MTVPEPNHCGQRPLRLAHKPARRAALPTCIAPSASAVTGKPA